MAENVKIKKVAQIDVWGARVHNLKNIDVHIPRNQLVVITGLSGSGKSSLAFDTLYAEGQRRYMETLSAYARQFIGSMERPDVDKIDGLSPVISIEQKTTSRSPRSTVGTVTEIWDFLRLLYARTADAYSYNTGERMVQYSEDQILQILHQDYAEQRIQILSPLVRGRKGHYRELFEQIARQGYLRVRVNGKIREIQRGMKLDRYKTHDIEVVVDRLKLDDTTSDRLKKSVDTALKLGKGVLSIVAENSDSPRFFSRHMMCPSTGLSYEAPEPNTFSFNSPRGACHHCNGLGQVSEVELKKVIPNPIRSIRKGGLAPIGEFKKSWIFNQLEIIGERYGFTLDTPIEDIAQEGLDVILYGAQESFEVENKNLGITRKYSLQFEGIIQFIDTQAKEANSASLKRWADDFMNKVECSICNGSRLQLESRSYKILDKSIADVAELSISELLPFLKKAKKSFSGNRALVGNEILKELVTRTGFLLNVGLEYLSLSRSAKTLSGGEAQRIRLATQIGSQLTNVLYILDEPSIGLHQRDNHKLIDSLIQLRDLGNSVIVVEHDKDMMEAADFILDMGPAAGKYGGRVVGQGKLEDIKKGDSITSQYLDGRMQIAIPEKRREGSGDLLVLQGASGNNLKNLTLKLPLQKLIVITGVSGSGKSTLINETLAPILSQHFFKALKKPMPYKKINGLEHLDKVITIDQSPIGRTSRSNPATYTAVLNEIRNLFAQLSESKIRGYKAGRFSFNVKGGRCETCQGAGVRTIEMNFLPDVYVQCETCNGRRFNRETLEVRYKGKSIADILDMSVNEAVEFFENIPKILTKIKTLKDVGLGYITLGQQSTTLSGGEAQRVKLATELSKRDTGKTLYILDEPTTGLHFEDVRILMDVLQKLVDRSNTVLVIEHNLDVIKLADHIIDLGPEGGSKGGQIIAEGTPEEVVQKAKGFTAQYLEIELSSKQNNSSPIYL
jgi:excinuclease ABC subunit A